MIVDTNALSAFADGSSLAIAALQAAGEVSVPVIVVGEFRYGITHSRVRYGITHSRGHREYEAWLEQYLPAFVCWKSRSKLRWNMHCFVQN